MTSVISPQIDAFIVENHDGRISQLALNWLRKATHLDDAILITMSSGPYPIALAACKWDDEYIIRHSLLVVARSHRGRGIGTTLFKMLASDTKAKGIDFKAWIAEDNIASIKAATKANLHPICEEYRTRKKDTEEFKAVQFAIDSG